MKGQIEEEETIAHVYMSDTLWSVNEDFFSSELKGVCMDLRAHRNINVQRC